MAALVWTATDADAGVGAGKLLEDEDVGEEVGAGATVGLRHADAHQAELAELPVQVGGEAVLAIPGGSVRLDLGPCEVAGKRLNLALVVGEREVHEGEFRR